MKVRWIQVPIAGGVGVVRKENGYWSELQWKRCAVADIDSSAVVII